MSFQSNQYSTSALQASADGPGIAADGNGMQTDSLPIALLGGALLVAGLRRGSGDGLVLALAGGDLLCKGVTGRHLHEALAFRPGDGAQLQGTASTPTVPEVERTLTIGAPADELYRLWRQPETPNRVMGHVGEVTVRSEDEAHWVVHGPLGQTWEWDTRIVEEQPGERVRWESLPGAAFPNEGEVSFRPGPADWGTETTLRVRFDPPGGLVGDAALKLAGPAPKLFLGQALRRFKSLAETGEIPTLYRQPAARNDGRDI